MKTLKIVCCAAGQLCAYITIVMLAIYQLPYINTNAPGWVMGLAIFGIVLAIAYMNVCILTMRYVFTFKTIEI
jgi:hypothetical protein